MRSTGLETGTCRRGGWESLAEQLGTDGFDRKMMDPGSLHKQENLPVTAVCCL